MCGNTLVHGEWTCTCFRFVGWTFFTLYMFPSYVLYWCIIRLPSQNGRVVGTKGKLCQSENEGHRSHGVVAIMDFSRILDNLKRSPNRFTAEIWNLVHLLHPWPRFMVVQEKSIGHIVWRPYWTCRKYLNDFFSETIMPIESKLCIHGLGKVAYQICSTQVAT